MNVAMFLPMVGATGMLARAAMAAAAVAAVGLEAPGVIHAFEHNPTVAVLTAVNDIASAGFLGGMAAHNIATPQGAELTNEAILRTRRMMRGDFTQIHEYTILPKGPGVGIVRAMSAAMEAKTGVSLNPAALGDLAPGHSLVLAEMPAIDGIGKFSMVAEVTYADGSFAENSPGKLQRVGIKWLTGEIVWQDTLPNGQATGHVYAVKDGFNFDTLGADLRQDAVSGNGLYLKEAELRTYAFIDFGNRHVPARSVTVANDIGEVAGLSRHFGYGLEANFDYRTIPGQGAVNCHASAGMFMERISGRMPKYWNASMEAQFKVGVIENSIKRVDGKSLLDEPLKKSLTDRLKENRVHLERTANAARQRINAP
jgi:hypothetical protein